MEAQGSKRDSGTCDCGAIALTDFEGRDSDTRLLFHITLADIVSVPFAMQSQIYLDKAGIGVVSQDDGFSAPLACPDPTIKLKIALELFPHRAHRD